MAERTAARRALIFLALLYAIGRVLQIFPYRIPTLLIVILHVVPPALFAWIHGRRVLGTRGILVFMGVCIVTGTLFESLSLRTGFPFGHYVFTSVMGPKVAQLPILLALAYVGVGYLSWTLAALILSAPHGSRTATFLTPMIAAAVMCSWDLAMDPIWSNIDGAWVWFRGGGYFGVPFSNYCGWFLTNWSCYQVFAWWLRTQSSQVSSPDWNRLAVPMFGITAAGNLLLAVPSAVPSTYGQAITDAAGRHWLVSDVIHMCVLISMLVMLPFALVAWVRGGGSPAAESGSPQTHARRDPVRVG